MRTMKILSAILFIAVLALAWRLKSVTTVVTQQRQMVAQQQEQIKALHKRLDDKSAQETLSMQIHCSEMASKFLSSRSWKIGSEDDYTSHFNSKLRKCFVLVSGYSPKDNFVTIDLYDSVEGRRYATFNGYSICNDAITYNPKKCALESGSIWFDGNDRRVPADFTIGYGGISGDSNTQKIFRERIQPYMSE
jgi:hypothetical protein